MRHERDDVPALNGQSENRWKVELHVARQRPSAAIAGQRAGVVLGGVFAR